MSQLEVLLRAVGQSVCDHGRRALAGDARFEDVLADVARAALDLARRDLTPADLRLAVSRAATAAPAEYADALAAALAAVGCGPDAAHRPAAEAYLGALPTSARQVLQRPSDLAAATPPPAAFGFTRPDDLLLFLPPRPPKLHPATPPAGRDDLLLTDPVGAGECGEVWAAAADGRPHPEAAVKFVDPAAAARAKAMPDVLRGAFELAADPGVVALRAAHLDADQPWLESAWVPGCDLTALMYDWKWRYDGPKPDAALKLVRRLAEIVGRGHAVGHVHRDLKPANVRLCPGGDGRFTLWVTDWGWGQVQAARAADLAANGAARTAGLWLALRGAFTPLYAAPQVTRGDYPDPRDDVFALGAIWYQLLRRDPRAEPPAPGAEADEELDLLGLSAAQARALSSCLAPRADRRPADARAVADLLGKASLTAPPTAAADTRAMPALAAPPAEPKSELRSSAHFRIEKKLGVPAAGAPPKPGAKPKLFDNAADMRLVLVPPGRFAMGGPDDEPGSREHERPVGTVALTAGFYLAVTPVTQRQYEKLMGANPAKFRRGHGGGPDHPVETVGWHDAVAFCHKLSDLPAEAAAGRHYRLPTEAEWEYACRAGTATAFWCGDRLTARDAHFAGGSRAGKAGTAPVADRPANPLGLYDMHGNVFEWTADWYDEYAYMDRPPADPTGPPRGALKVVRGGCWATAPGECRSAARRGHPPDAPVDTVGFRVACDLR